MIQPKQIEIAKELDDVLSLVVELVKDLKAKKAIGDLASENLPGLMSAMSGIDQVGDELKLNRKEAIQTVALRVSELVEALLPV
jgi:hypothetical protein